MTCLGTCLAQSGKCTTLDLGVVSLSPMLDIELTLKTYFFLIKKKKKN